MQGKNLQKTLLILLLISVIVGCSSVKLGYRFMDNAIRWKINDYVSLNAQQSRTVTQGINDFHRWHQATQLSLYANFMQKAAKRFEQTSLSTSELSQLYDEAFALALTSVDELMPVISDMLLSLSPEQILLTLKKIEIESAKEMKKDFGITPAQRLVKRQNKMIKRVVKWTGPLNKSQLGIIADWAKAMPVDESLRVARQDKFVSMLSTQLKDRSNPEQFKQALSAQIKTPERFSSAQYKQSYAKRKLLMLSLMSDLFGSLTARQKTQLINSTKKYQSDFLYLAPRS